MKIYFVRHGRSIANASGIIATPQSPLAEEGLDQARQTGQDLKGYDVKIIVSSNFIRAQQTAEVLASELGIPVDKIILIPELGERRMGELEGKPKRHENAFYVENDAEFGFEPQKDLIQRLISALEKIKDLGANTEGSMVVVGHAVSGYYLQQVAKGYTSFEQFDFSSQIKNAEFIEIPIK